MKQLLILRSVNESTAASYNVTPLNAIVNEKLISMKTEVIRIKEGDINLNTIIIVATWGLVFFNTQFL